MGAPAQADAGAAKEVIVKSDIIHVIGGSAGTKEARAQAEKVAAFRELNKKNTMQLSLMTEEMMGIMQALTGETEADFWIESEGNVVTLHLKAETVMNAEMRQKLLALSKDGKNHAVKGFMGKIKDIFQRLTEPADGTVTPPAAYAMGYCNCESTLVPMDVCLWSLNQYKAAIKTGNAPLENWDELEKSIVSKLADDVQIGIIDDQVEIVIIKAF